MSNTLFKDTLTVQVVTATYIPPTPPTPPRPAYSSWSTQQYCGWQDASAPPAGSTDGGWIPGVSSFEPGNLGSTQEGVWVSGHGATTKTGAVKRNWVCTPTQVPTQHGPTPGTPGAPGQTVYGLQNQTAYNLGWNSGAHSVAFFHLDAFIEFQCHASVVGVICGMNLNNGIVSDYNGNLINYAFYLARGNAHVMQGGVIGVFAGYYDDATVFHIERSGDTISWQMDGNEVYSISGADTDDGVMEAALYSGTDAVLNPSIVQVSPLDTGDQTGTIDASFAPMEVLAYRGKYAAIVGSFAPMKAHITAGLIKPEFAVLEGSFSPLISMLIGITGEIGEVDAEFRPMQVLAADHPYGELFASFAPLNGYLDATEGNFNATIQSTVYSLGALVPAGFLVVVMNSTASITSAIGVVIELDAAMLSQASLGTTWAVEQTLEVVMLSLAQSGWVLGVPEEEAEVWVVNLDNKGSTNYSNYAFNSFALWDNQYYGASPEGVSMLDGDTDDGAPVVASMSFGTRDFGTRNKKTIQNAYVGTAGDGNIYIKLLAEGRSFLYRVRDYNENIQQQRFTFGKGLRTNYVGVELYNENGADFEIDNLTFMVADMTRNI